MQLHLKVYYAFATANVHLACIVDSTSNCGTTHSLLAAMHERFHDSRINFWRFGVMVTRWSR